MRARLTPPKWGTFVVALLLGLVGILAHQLGWSIPFVDAFTLVMVGYVLLLLGAVFKGI